jgi:hypothetical protein
MGSTARAPACPLCVRRISDRILGIYLVRADSDCIMVLGRGVSCQVAKLQHRSRELIEVFSDG